MILTDTHTHLNSGDMEYPVNMQIQRAGDHHVSRFFIPNIDRFTIEEVLELGRAYPHQCFPMLGLHPVHVDATYMEHLEAIEKALETNKVYAIGEVGLDLYHDISFLKQQQHAFLIQARKADQMGLPLVLHCRNAFDELMELIGDLKELPLRGIFHCFGGTVAQARQVIDAGFLLGVGGVLTYKNSGLAATLEEIPLEHLVLETDAPYLSPVPRRGKINESANLLYIAEKLADIKKVSLEELALITTENSKRVFDI